jgi:KDO2-lipid IV(A) lauroyltransferase
MERLAAIALRALIRVFALFSIETQRTFGRFLGVLACRLDLESVRITRINVTRCFPELQMAARERLVRSSIENTAQLVTEAGVVFHWSPDRWKALITRVEGESLIDPAQRNGRGVLILVPHLGNWEFLALYLGRYRVTALYDPPRLRRLESPIRRARSRAGARLEPISQHGIRAVYRALAEAQVVALLPDQVPRRDAGLHIEFFGHPALTMTFAHRLITRTHPEVLIGTALRVPGGFHLRFVPADPEIHDPESSRSLAAMNRSLEKLVRSAPEQYQWEYRRFKRQPATMPDWYAVPHDRGRLSGAKRPG